MSDALINGLAGAGGGIIAQLITYPLQTVNTRQQTERDLKKEKRKLGTIEQMCQVVKHEGWGRLYGGLTPSLAGTAASQSTIMGMTKQIDDREKEKTKVVKEEFQKELELIKEDLKKIPKLEQGMEVLLAKMDDLLK
ncbi:hypothetical protein L484_026367 [Morus notabilis]|uniref:Peroxisomal nicotinamide adenine dinucleotide carrier n=1 Tax=Morus notabilis TaxID=981085 RepID=W9QY86_9ROSA|nr:hypothetical protein L484_026367 [Morus notabilis]